MLASIWCGVFLTAPVGARLILPEDNALRAQRQDWRHWYVTVEQFQLLNCTRVSFSQMDLHCNSNTYLYDLIPTLPHEHRFDAFASVKTTRNIWWLAYAASAAYLVSLWGGIEYMKNKKAFDLKGPLALWNLILAAFSFIGMMRTVPWLLLMMTTYGWTYSLCRMANASYGCGACGLWVLLFVYSKYAELLDTAFLVLRKRRVSFLHWYHHCSVLLYCWHAYVWESPTGIHFVAMNYTVHAIMYFYYFLAGVCAKPPKWALFVTVLQLLQMAGGIVVTLCHLSILMFGSVENCDGHTPNLNAALGMYATYFGLFAQFLVARYCKKRNKMA